MAVRTVYHLDLDSAKTEGAALALLPGDPGRVEALARTAPFERGRELACKREYRTWIAYLGRTPVLVTSTGIGGPSASIAIDELAQLGVHTLLRVGTTGAIQADIDVGTVIVTTGAVRLDGASRHYAPIEYPAVAHPEVVQAAISAASALGIACRAGVSASCDTFYPGQERYDSYTGYVPRRFQGATEEWRRLHVLNYEMESSTVLTLTAAMGLRGGCVAGVVVNRTRSEAITRADLEAGETHAVRVAVGAMARLAGR
ncbi:MAG TPA: uridine phosphorylase [Vicinamibacterales bacterium]|nr:uridine phosphorylase [Vicinamibacterales bacterium]HPW20616.1 uridine phosphorylase [Vicinamibacterales bacterium]